MGEPYYTKERLEELLDSTCGGIAEAALDYLADSERLRGVCPICGHKWRQHDPEDGQCDSAGDEIGPCGCGRDLTWMQTKIVALSRKALDG